jgi:uncharacterized protein (AIM24 family)
MFEIQPLAGHGIVEVELHGHLVEIAVDER